MQDNKTTHQLWDEYCELTHNTSPSSWIIVSPQIVEELNQLKKIKKWKKKK
jgi:hypothetical protein